MNGKQPTITTKPKSSVKFFINRVLHWLRKHFGSSKDKRVKILESTYSGDRRTALLSLSRDTIGAARTWKLNNSKANGSLFVTLDNLATQREYYRQLRKQATEHRKPYPVSADEKALYLEGYLGYTHRVGVFWCFWANGNAQLLPLAVVDIDFDEQKPVNSTIAKQRAIEIRDERLKRNIMNSTAIKVCEMMMKELRDLAPSFEDWDTRLKKIDYENLVSSYLASYYRVSGKADEKAHQRHLKRDMSAQMLVDGIIGAKEA